MFGNSKNLWNIYLDDKDQPRYGVDERCIYWRKFKGYKNRRIVDLITINVSSTEEENFYEIILHGVEARVNKLILVGMFGAMITNNKATQEYYLVEWMSGPYTVQENTVMKGVEPPHTTFAR